MSYVWREIEAERRFGHGIRIGAGGGAARRPPAGSVFPEDATARIFRPARSATTSGKARTRRWVLRFDRRTPDFIEPLMGWTGGDDTLVQVELSFPSLESAVAYAERQGLAYRVEGAAGSLGGLHPARDRQALEAERRAALEDAYAGWFVFALMQARYGWCDVPMLPDLERALTNPAAVFRSPAEVVTHPALSSDAKRQILTRWAWDEYLLQLATEEAMPEGREPSRLDAVKSALTRLDRLEGGAVLVVSRPGRGRAGAGNSG